MKTFSFLLCIAVLILCLPSAGAVAQVQTSTVTVASPDPPDMTGRLRLEATVLGGIGFTNIKVGVTNKDEDVNISGGGGFGGSLGMTYWVSRAVDVNLMVGLQNSPLQPEVSNASGKFMRVLVLGTVKYGIPVTSDGTLKFGAGAGYYSPGDLDIDLSKVTDGDHNIFSYDGTVGFHVTADYDWILSDDITWGFGLKYTEVSYTLNKAQMGGAVVPQSMITGSDRDKVIKLKGSAFDLTAFIAINL